MEINELQTIYDIDKDNSLIFSRTLNGKIINEKIEENKGKKKMEFDREED